MCILRHLEQISFFGKMEDLHGMAQLMKYRLPAGLGFFQTKSFCPEKAVYSCLKFIPVLFSRAPNPQYIGFPTISFFLSSGHQWPQWGRDRFGNPRGRQLGHRPVWLDLLRDPSGTSRSAAVSRASTRPVFTLLAISCKLTRKPLELLCDWRKRIFK